MKDDVHEGTKDEKTIRSCKKIVIRILKQIEIKDDIISDINIVKVTYSRKKIRDEFKDTILVEFREFSTIRTIKGNLSKLCKDYKVSDYIPNQFRDIYAIYSKIANCYVRDGKNTRIWMNSEGFTLRVKNRSDLRSWSELAPIIPPLNMPLAYLGNMNNITENEIKEIENDRIREIISKRDERENDKEIRMKDREMNKEKKRIEKEKELEENENTKKRNLSINTNEDQINAKKAINEIEDIEMKNSQNSNTDISV